jgi:hypothetical protein
MENSLCTVESLAASALLINSERLVTRYPFEDANVPVPNYD